MQRRLIFFAGIYNSFEKWVQFELAYYFHTRHGHPDFTCVVEQGYPKGFRLKPNTRQNADIAISEGRCFKKDDAQWVEIKLTWDNNLANRKASKKALQNDPKRIEKAGQGVFILIVVGAAEGKQNDRHYPVKVRPPGDKLGEIEGGLLNTSLPSKGKVLWSYDGGDGDQRGYRLPPRIIVKAYPIN